jgi:hypothetical protein
MTQQPARKAYYHFRYGGTRPELLSLAQKVHADEAALFLPWAEENCDGPATLDEIDRTARLAEPIMESLRASGIVPSVNIFWTLGFSDFPHAQRVARGRFPFRWAVNTQGVESQVIACPNDEAWRAHMTAMYARYARLKPAVIWVDDDVRLTLRADVQGPCLCASCMTEIGRRTGRNWTRQDLLSAIVSDGPENQPNPTREAWTGFQREIIETLIKRFADAVHEVSPTTRLGLMFSPPEGHAPEGRRWAEYFAMTGEPRGIGRPGIGCYNEGNAFQFAAGLAWARQVQKLAPAGYALAPEIESYPYSPHAKSYALDKAQMTLCQVLGMNQITINILPFAAGGSELIAEEACHEMASVKPRLSAIAALEPEPCGQLGVRLFVHDDVTRHVTGGAGLPKPILLMRKRPWETSLPLLGIPTTFHDSPVVAFAGEEINCLSDAELDQVFTGGVLLDARAADCLIKRGRAGLVGARARKDNATHCKETPVKAGAPMNSRFDGEAWQFDWEPAAQVHSQFRNYNDQVTGTGVVSFENKLGGRVLIMPYDSQSGAMVFGIPGNALASPGFVSPARQVFLQPLIRWLFKDQACPGFFTDHKPVYPLVVRLKNAGTLAALTNLGADPVNALAWLEKLADGKPYRWLDERGEWHDSTHPDRGTLASLGIFQTAVAHIG